MKKKGQLVYHAATRNKFMPLGITSLGGPSIYAPEIHAVLKPFLRIIWREEREEARKRIHGHHYKPSDAWHRRASKLLTHKTF